MENTDFQLPALLENIQSLINEEARAKALQVTLEMDETPALLRGDPT